MISAVFNQFAQADGGGLTTSLTGDTGTTLGAIAVLISLIVSGVGLYRSFRLDQRAAKKQDIDTVIENYRLMLTESKDREKKLEAINDQLNTKLEKAENMIAEQRITITRLESENGQLRRELEAYRGAKANAQSA